MTEKEYKKAIVAGALIEKDGKYLLIKESHGPAKGKWNLPAGQWCWGESIVACAEREVKEESGYDFKAQNILGVFTTQRQEQDIFVMAVIFTGVLGEAGQAVDSEEMKWFSKDEIMALDKNSLRMTLAKELIEDYENGVRYPLSIIKEDI